MPRRLIVPAFSLLAALACSSGVGGDGTGPGVEVGQQSLPESPALASSGRATITSRTGGRFRIEGHYDLWLEISVDGGQTCDQGDAAVRMTLGRPTP